ncbi:DUF4190 domain-containing protein [Amycolatopsis balhimycina DSM 5908]|uniref:DUF4190 domain-containing protein n=1 Tax=Amycolatopsis balhimycina DSM 5908 TaxID=1081091 RepID=A0A428W2W6_AMYBA|nr:DUF4190 domain-containing protein [Amycolatopsis balhimycina]RSM37419.1 DUF4190 domain-containing protein [Amycolatopsis balhimycina DSM 5908]
MTDPSGDKDRPAADPAAAYDPPPTADPATYAPENYDPPAPDPTVSDPTGSDTTVSATAGSETTASDMPAPGPAVDGTTAARDYPAAPEQPGHLPPGAFETPAAHIPGTPYAAPGQPQPMYQPSFPQPTYQQPYPPAYGQPYVPPAPYGQPYPASPRGQDNALAIGALVCSILGFCSGVTALAGLIMGHIALSKTNRGEAGGRGLATAAVIVGYVVIALWIGFFTTLIILGANGYLN